MLWYKPYGLYVIYKNVDRYIGDLQNELNLVYKGSETKKSGITAFVTTKDEFIFIPSFLRYYRNLGVEQFIFIDNNSRDQSSEYLKKQSDVVLYNTTNDFSKARSGTDWVEFLREIWAKNSWCLFIDPDEFLVFPLMNNYGLKGLTEYMDSRNFEFMSVFHLDVFKLDKFVNKLSLNHLMRFMVLLKVGFKSFPQQLENKLIPDFSTYQQVFFCRQKQTQHSLFQCH